MRKIGTLVSKTETILYFTVWTASVLYSIYRFSVPIYEYFYNFKDEYNDFTPGIFGISGKRDKADFEWEAIGYILKQFYPWALFYLIFNEYIRYLCMPTEVSQMLQVVFTLSYIQIKIGFQFIIIILVQPVLFYCVLYINRRLYLVWFCSSISILSIAYFKHISGHEVYQKLFTVNEYDLFLITLSLSWMNLKCTSFYLNVNGENHFTKFFSYCLYPPTVFTGPFISYENYHNSIIISNDAPINKRIRRLMLNILYCLFWFVFGNICLHFIYVNAASYQPKVIASLDSWSLYGYGYAMGQFFHIKYVVLYGLSTSLASFENVNVPRLPRCIGRIHLYSDMWKYFDPGLYQFLVRHVYLPVLEPTQMRLLASLTCFLFVYVWHGLEKYILIWTSLNYLGIVIEHTAGSLHKYFLENVGTMKAINPNWLRRVKCFLTAPLLAMSAVSNFYFFAGTEIGIIFFDRLFKDSVKNYLILLLVLYCCCQVSSRLKTVKARKCN